MNRPARLLLSGALALIGLAAPLSAHEVWIEREGSGAARVFLREIDETMKEEGDETHRLEKSKLFVESPAKALPLVRRDGYFEAVVPGKGDLRLVNDDVFAPWDEGGVKHGQVYHARAGRSETVAKLDFELVPVKSGGNEFALLFRGKPVAGVPVTVFAPGAPKRDVTSDQAGRVTISDAAKGRYVLVASTTEDVARKMSGQDVARVHHMTTLSFMQ